MKLLIRCTAIVESITGLALLFFSKLTVLILLGVAFDAVSAHIVAKVAGAAIFSIAFLCWIARDSNVENLIVKTLLLYNAIIVAIGVFGILNYELNGPGIWFVITLHTVLSAWCLLELFKKNELDKEK
jgi:hypothetical protein